MIGRLLLWLMRDALKPLDDEVGALRGRVLELEKVVGIEGEQDGILAAQRLFASKIKSKGKGRK